MRWGPRRATPKVRDGKVQRKNRSALTPHYSITPQDRRRDFIHEHRQVLHRLGVKRDPVYDEKGRVSGFYRRCLFTETSARGFQLMHVLLHELGHHHDRMTSRTQTRPTRGESYAEDYANRYADSFWERYFKVFGW
jgi:hypothetical protein